MLSRLHDRYRKDILPALQRELGRTNALAIPRLEKIVLNMGLGEASQNPKLLDAAVEELTAISGQKPVVTRARKAIANFKLREGMAIGVMVTLRGERMYEFFERLVHASLPRVRDFKGVPDRAFDGHWPRLQPYQPLPRTSGEQPATTIIASAPKTARVTTLPAARARPGPPGDEHGPLQGRSSERPASRAPTGPATRPPTGPGCPTRAR